MDARDLVDLVVDVVVDAEDRRADHECAHHDGDDEPSGERAQLRRGEISRSGHGTDGVAATGRGEPPWWAGTAPRRRGARLVPWSGAPRRRRRVRAGQQPAVRCSATAPCVAAARPSSGSHPTRWWSPGHRRLRRARLRSTPGFWVGWCSFELGHAAERVVARGASPEPPRRCPTSCSPGSTPLAVVDPRGGIAVRGDGAGRALLDADRAVTRRGHRSARVLHGRADAAGSSSLDRDDYADRVTCGARPAARRRVLPGQPHPPAHVRRRASTRSRSTRALARAHPAPHLALLHAAGARRRHRGRVGVTRAVPARATAATSRPGRSRAPRRPARRCARAARTTPRT